MKRIQWQTLVESLPENLTVKAAAKYLDLPYFTVRYWLLQLGYKFRDGRNCCWSQARRAKFTKLVASKVDWDLTNVAIAKRFGVSRQRVHQVRSRLKFPKIGGRK